jgi:uncharacterized protein (TIGR03435 family)
MKLVLAIAWMSCVQGVTCAQVNAKRPEFEVASVRQTAPAGPQSASGPRLTGAGRISITSDRASYQGVTLERLLMSAYDLKPFQISGPAWIETEHYDIVATIPEGTAKEDVPTMLQNLLIDRFHITLHLETKEQPVYLLGVGKDTSKLKPSSDDQRESMSFIMGQIGTTELKFKAETMADFANILSVHLNRAVTDETGLTGRFDITLPVDSQDMQPGSDSLSSSWLTAVRSVGLKLEPGKAPMKHLIIDKAEKMPTEN